MLFGTVHSLKCVKLLINIYRIDSQLELVSTYKYLGLSMNPNKSPTPYIKQSIAIVAKKLNTNTSQ